MSFPALRREIGMVGAIVTGLGSILGTGAFVAIGVASGAWGDAVVPAIPLAGVVAVFNGLSSAYLAGRFPVAGGTYEYGYQALGPWWGFTAGWLFLLAKTASAATAALGVALYLDLPVDERVVAIGSVVMITGLVLAGLKRTTAVNAVLVTMTVAALVSFSVVAVATSGQPGFDPGQTRVGDTLAAMAFLFVSYTGYGRIATLGEEVHRPAHTIPRAVIVTLTVAIALYFMVEIGGRSVAGSHWGSGLESGETLAGLLAEPYSSLVAIGAVTAMLGVLLNLVLGLSRVWLAMGRRLDMPERLSRLSSRAVPVTAIVTSAVPVAALTLLGDISLAWSFSAFTVLLYYGITNLAALKMNRGRITSWLGLGSCLLLSFFVPPGVWAGGAGIIALGLVWKSQRRV